MYNTHFGFDALPFSVNPDRQFAFTSGDFIRARETALRALRAGRRCVVISGQPGSGKTTLLYHLAEHAGPQLRLISVNYAGLDFAEIIDLLAEQLLPAEQLKNAASADMALLAWLHNRPADAARPVLVIDEAQNLTDNTLRALRELSGAGAATGPPVLQLLLAGQRELERGSRKLETQPGWVAAVYCRLMPLDATETGDYIRYRLSAAGCSDPDLFSPDAEQLIARHSRGVPRLINALCGYALLVAFEEGRGEVDVDAVHEAIDNLAPTPGAPLTTALVDDPCVEPLTEPLAEPLAEPLTEPLAEPLTEPLAEPLTEPLAEPLTEPLADDATVPKMLAPARRVRSGRHAWRRKPALPLAAAGLGAVALAALLVVRHLNGSPPGDLVQATPVDGGAAPGIKPPPAPVPGIAATRYFDAVLPGPTVKPAGPPPPPEPPGKTPAAAVTRISSAAPPTSGPALSAANDQPLPAAEVAVKPAEAVPVNPLPSDGAARIARPEHFVTAAGVVDRAPVGDDDLFRPGRVYAYARVTAPRDETLTLRWYDAGDRQISSLALRVRRNLGGYRTYGWKTLYQPGDYQVKLFNEEDELIGQRRFTVR